MGVQQLKVQRHDGAGRFERIGKAARDKRGA
jgi:hypothetical protein